MKTQRLAKYLASCGISSRRKAEDLITSGSVSVNGETITDPATNIDLAVDIICVNGSEVRPENMVYFLLNKPRGYTTTTADKHADRLITELIDTDARIFPVGRLDRETTGLIILTNDGDFAQNLIHPSKNIEKIYIAKVDKALSENNLQSIREGIKLEDGRAQAQIEKISEKTYKATIHIGRNRIVRRIFEHFGSTVLELERIAIGNIRLGDLKVGEYREVTRDEINIK